MAFIDIEDKRWVDLLDDTIHDLYHLPVFTKIESILLGGTALAWYYEDGSLKALIPLVKRPIADSGFFDLVSPYGYPGILCNKSLDTSQAILLLGVFHQEAADAGFISSFLRLNPFTNNWKINGIEGNPLYLRQWFHGETVSVELNAPLESIKAGYTENHRRNIHRLIEKGFYTRINDWQYLEAFMDAYYETMERKQAHPYYFFPAWYFDQLKDSLDNHLVFVAVFDADDNFCAGGLFTVFYDIMQFHLGATTEQSLYFSPSKLMIDAAIAYASHQKLNFLHLGGGLGGSIADGLFHFKKGFGKKYHNYSTLRLIHQPEVYNRLRNTEGMRLAYINPSFFPAYRLT